MSGLYLHDCQLDELPPATIDPLNGTLVNLWLNGNRLTGVDRRLAGLFAGLTHLRLGSNPLRCNCDTLWLKELYDRRGGATFRGAEQPTCAGPSTVRGRHFGQLSVADFRCRAPAFGNVDASFYPDLYHQGDSGVTRGHLRCTATGEPTPTLYWIRPSGKTIRFDAAETMDTAAALGVDSPSDAVAPQRLHLGPGNRQPRHGSSSSNTNNNGDEGRNEAVLELIAENDDGEDAGVGRHSRMETGMYICIAANEVGNVTLTVNLSWPKPASRLSHAVDRLTTWRPRDGENNGLFGVTSSTPPLLLGSASSSSSVAAARLAVINLDEAIDRKNREKDKESTAVAANDDDGGYQPAASDVFKPEVSPASEPRTFSTVEMAIAIVGTHIATLLLLLVVAVATMPGCRRLMASALTARHRRRQRGIDQPTNAGGTREVSHRANRPIDAGNSTLRSASMAHSAYDSLLQPLSTPSRTLNESAYHQSTKDFTSTFGSRKYFWPPPSTAGTSDFESS